MPLKRPLPTLPTARLVTGIVLGVAFAATFHTASVLVARGGLGPLARGPEGYVEGLREYNTLWEDRPGFEPLPIPEIVPEAEPHVAWWIEPFWAGLSAAFGQTLVLTVWFWGTRRREPGRLLPHGKHVLGSLTTGWMWMAILASFSGRFWIIYSILVLRGNLWMEAFGEAPTADPLVPFVPYGAAAFLLVVFLAMEPWRGLRFQYRCGRWPAWSLVATLTLAALLYGSGRWLLPGG